MNKHWLAIEQLLASKGCIGRSWLNPGCTSEDIRDLEAHIGHQLPESVKDLLLQHDGEKSGPGLIHGYQMLSVDEIRANWDNWRSIDEEEMNADCADFMSSNPAGYIKPVYTNRHWIPLAHDWAGNHIGLDFDPDIKGTPGQVIRFGRDEDEKQLIAATHSEFLELLIADLGRTRWTGEYLEWPRP
jgi:cell wall assembly regulator SMI1